MIIYDEEQKIESMNVGPLSNVGATFKSNKYRTNDQTNLYVSNYT